MAKSRKAGIRQFERGIVGIEEASPYVTLLAYGRHGTHKTRLGASGPKAIIFDINEKGTMSARNFKGAKVRQIKTWEDLIMGYWYLKAGEHEHQTVVLDSITQLQNLCMTQVLGDAEDRDPNRPPSQPVQRDWGRMATMMKEQLLNFRNLPMHVVFLAQERIMEDEDAEETLHVPDLSPSVRGTAMGAVAIIGRTYVGKVKVADKKKRKSEVKWVPKMLVGPHDRFETKDRTGALGDIVLNPSMPKIIEASGLDGEEEEE
jgi:hypothetical protein